MVKSAISYFTIVLVMGCAFSVSRANYSDEITTSEEELPNPALDISTDRLNDEYQLAGRNTKKKVPSDWPDAKACNNIYKQVLGALDGNKNRASCYMGLFFMETTCDHTLTQAAGNEGNAHTAYGLCSLEKSPDVREDNERGPDCENISGVVNQVKCCRAIMRKKPRYFGPYRRGEVGQCG